MLYNIYNYTIAGYPKKYPHVLNPHVPVSTNYRYPCPRCDGPLHQGRHLLRMCCRPAVGEGDDDLRQQRLGRSCGETVLGGFVGGKTGRPLEEPLEEQ